MAPRHAGGETAREPLTVLDVACVFALTAAVLLRAWAGFGKTHLPLRHALVPPARAGDLDRRPPAGDRPRRLRRSVVRPTRPSNLELWFVFLMAPLHSDYLAGTGQVPFAALAALAIVAAVREAGGRRTAALAAALAFLLVPEIWQQARTAMIDLGLAALLLASLPFSLRVARRASAGDLTTAAAALGLAVGTKYVGLPLALPFALAAAFSARRRARARPLWRRRPSSLFATGGFWYLRNALVTGNPFYPVATLGLPGLYDAPAMRAWIYHLPIGQVGALGEMIGAAGFGFAIVAAVVTVWRAPGAAGRRAPARARRHLLALDPLSGEPVPVPGVRRGGGGDRAGARAGDRPAGDTARLAPGRGARRSRRVLDARAMADRSGRRARRGHGPWMAPSSGAGAAAAPFAADRRSRRPGRSRRRDAHDRARPLSRARSRLRDRRRLDDAWTWFRANVQRRARRLHRHEPRLSAGGARALEPGHLRQRRRRPRRPAARLRAAIAAARSRRHARAGPLPRRRQLRRLAGATCAPRAPRCCSSRRSTRSSPATSPPTATASPSSAPGPTPTRRSFTFATPRPTPGSTGSRRHERAERQTRAGAGGAGRALAVRRRTLSRPDGRDRSLLQPAARRHHPRATRSSRARTCCPSPTPTRATLNLAWLFQIVLALAYRAGGIAGTVLLKTTFVLATWALLFRVALRRGAHPAAAAAALALAAWAAEPRFVERPHLCTFLGLAYPPARARARRARTSARAHRARSARRSSGPTPTPASSWPRPCSRSTRPGAAIDRRARGRAARGAARAPASCRSSSPRRRARVRSATSPTTGECPGCGRCRSTAPRAGPLDGPFFFVAAGVLLATALPGRRLALAAPGARARPPRRAAHPLRRRVRPPRRPDPGGRAHRGRTARRPGGSGAGRIPSTPPSRSPPRWPA